MNNVVYFAYSLFCFTFFFFHQIVLFSVVLFVFCIVGETRRIVFIFCFNLVFVHCAQTFSSWCIWQYHVASFLVALESRTNIFFWLQTCFVSLFIELFIILYNHFFDHAKVFFFSLLNMMFSSCY
jgi:hypothetical protein